MKKQILLATFILSGIAAHSYMYADSSVKVRQFLKLEMTGGKKIILGGGILLNNANSI